MAEYGFATDNALKKQVYEETLFRDTIKESYFGRFMGKPGNARSIVHVEEKLTSQQGDNVIFGIRMRLTGPGVTSGQQLENNEEELTTYDYNISLEEYANAVISKGKLDRKRPMFSIDNQSKDALKGWGAEKIDSLCFEALDASPTKIYYGDGSVSSNATITSSMKLTPVLISEIKAWAKVGGSRSQTPLRPTKVDGKDYYVMIVHPDVMFDLKRNTAFEQAQREALQRGPENPIFSGSGAIWDGVVIHEHENIPITTTWGAGGNINGSRCAFMGEQALVWAWGQRPEMVEGDRDWKRKRGYAWSILARCGKPKFNSKDYGSIGVNVARTQIN